MRRLLATLIFLLPLAAQAYPDKVADTIALSVTPVRAVLGSTERFLYALHATSGRISVIDTLFFEETGTITFSGTPRDLQLSNDGDTLYVLTDEVDQVLTFDLAEDPSLPVGGDPVDVGTTDISFDRLWVAGVSGQDVLILSDGPNQTVYVYDCGDETLRDLSLDFEPVDMSLDPDVLRLGVLSAEGLFETYLLSSLLQVGATLDGGALTDTEGFNSFSTGKIGAADYGFVTNAKTEGEIFVVNMSQSNNVIAFTDADPGTSGVNPVLVGDSPSASLLVQVLRPAESGVASATYLYVSNHGDGTLSVVDTSGVIDAALVEPFATIESVTGVPQGGLLATASDAGYLYALNQPGAAVSVLTDQPFLTFVSAPSRSVGSDPADVVVRSNVGGSLAARLYTSASDQAVTETGDTLFDGEIVADTDTSVEISTDAFQEGDNTVAFFVKTGTLVGHRAINLLKDTNPPVPTGFQVEFGDRKIIAHWNGVDVSDFDHYEVSFGTDSSAAGGVGSLVSPASVATNRHVIQPVANGTTVYVRVESVDQTGNHSGFTAVRSETAEETVGLIGLSGQTGHCGAGFAGGFGLALVAIVLFRRRGVLSLLLLLLIPASSKAQTIAREEGPSKPHTSVEFRANWWLPRDDAIRSFYGKVGNELYTLRFAYVWRWFDFGVESGILSEGSRMVGVDTGRRSGETIRLTQVPVDFSVQARLELGRKPWVVPVARVGYEMLYFKLGEPTQSASGLKHGVVFGGSLRFMLSAMGFGKDLEDLMGIENFYIEGAALYRWQGSGGLDFGGWMFAPGLGVEF